VVARPRPSTVGTIATSPVADRAQVASYVAALTVELAAMARRQRLHTLGYLLDMARLEAEEAVQTPEGGLPPSITSQTPSGQRK